MTTLSCEIKLDLKTMRDISQFISRINITAFSAQLKYIIIGFGGFIMAQVPEINMRSGSIRGIRGIVRLGVLSTYLCKSSMDK